MTRSLTQSMAWLHTWAGLVFGWILFPVLFTGTLAVFHEEIERWMQPEVRWRSGVPVERAIAGAEQVLRAAAPRADRWGISLPSPGASIAEVSWTRGETTETRVVDVVSGAVLTPRQTEGGHFLVEVHYSLHGGEIGMWIVGAAGVVMLVAIVSGVIIHKRIFKDFFTFRPFAAAQRSWLDVHNATSVLTLPFQVMIAYTGIVIFHATFLPAGINALYAGNQDAFHDERFNPPTRAADGTGAPPAPLAPLVLDAERRYRGSTISVNVQHPGDAASVVTVYRRPNDRLTLLVDWVAFDGVSGTLIGSQDTYLPSLRTDGVLVGLHFAQFGGYWVRWLYFVLGLASSVMAAAGLVLFTIKRRDRRQTGVADAVFFRIAEAVNVALIVGLPIAVAAYLWANRLLPSALAEREAWEIRVFFLVWLLAGSHALARRIPDAWREQLWLAGAALLLLPVLNAWTTDTGLLSSLVARQWAVVGVDLVACGAGVLFVLAARARSRSLA